ncbi:N-acetylglucosamine kinase [Thermoanaerobacterium sp. DL9XJH110]|uniref:N-acetylglucosamine kinase n=1 Tax=Thermoanaerobacterium sp. DL9XJH110 TaxID=3386643 RepID=UPI003BB5B469
MGYIVAVDGGGTKTSLCVSDLKGQNKKYVYTGCTNYKSIGIKKTKENLREVINKALKILGISIADVEYFVMGLSGNDSEKDVQVLTGILKDIGINDNYYLCNDSELALFAGTDTPGIVVISGTGSIVYGMNNDGKKVRIGGWDYDFNDLGSGYWIGREAVKYMIMHCDGYFPHSNLFDRIKEHFNLKKIEDFTFYVTAGKKNFTKIASIAKLVVEEAKNGDKLSNSIIDKAVYYLAVQTEEAYKRLEFSGGNQKISIVLSGGVLSSGIVGERFKSKFIDLIGQLDNIQFIHLQGQPVEGGINIALKHLRQIKILKN